MQFNAEMGERPSNSSKISERPSSKGMAIRPVSKGKRVSLKDEDSVGPDFSNNPRKSNLAPISPNCINSVSDLSSVDNTTKKGILKPPKPRNFNTRTYDHNNSRLNMSHTKSKISANTPINEVLCESDDEVFEQVNMQKNMIDFFDNMIQHVGPKHLINKVVQKDVQKYRNEVQHKRRQNFISKKREGSPTYIYSDFKAKENSLDLDTANEDSIKFYEPKFGSHQQIKNDSKVVKQEMQKTIEDLKFEAERQK